MRPLVCFNPVIRFLNPESHPGLSLGLHFDKTMTIKDLLKLHLGDAVRISNKPFIHVGHTHIDLDNGQTIRWLYDDEGSMVSVSREDEEIIFFHEINEEVEPEGNTISFGDKEYEFSYEDTGTVANVEGEAVGEEDDRYMYSDYQSAEGDLLRLVSNETTGEKMAYKGKYVSEDDVVEV